MLNIKALHLHLQSMHDVSGLLRQGALRPLQHCFTLWALGRGRRKSAAQTAAKLKAFLKRSSSNSDLGKQFEGHTRTPGVSVYLQGQFAFCIALLELQLLKQELVWLCSTSPIFGRISVPGLFQ